MGKSTFSGPVSIGTFKDGALNNMGDVLLSQEICFTTPANIVSGIDADGQSTTTYNGADAFPFAAFGVASTASINLPANADIVDIIVDVPVAIAGPTAANLTMGVTTTGQDYVSTLNVVGATRTRPTFTNAQLLAMMNTGSNTTAFFQLTGTVANFTAGVVYVTVLYTQI